MRRLILSGIPGLIVGLTLLSSFVLFAQQATPSVSPAPIPVQILTAKKAFISNAGMDSASRAVFERGGDPQQPYNRFYAAMKDWGRYELVGAPADADLVFEIRFAAPLSDAKENFHAPYMEISILDAKTHFTLWNLSTSFEGAIRKATWDKNFADGMDRLMNDLKKLAGPPAAGAENARE